MRKRKRLLRLRLSRSRSRSTLFSWNSFRLVLLTIESTRAPARSLCCDSSSIFSHFSDFWRSLRASVSSSSGSSATCSSICPLTISFRALASWSAVSSGFFSSSVPKTLLRPNDYVRLLILLKVSVLAFWVASATFAEAVVSIIFLESALTKWSSLSPASGYTLPPSRPGQSTVITMLACSLQVGASCFISRPSTISLSGDRHNGMPSLLFTYLCSCATFTDPLLWSQGTSRGIVRLLAWQRRKSVKRAPAKALVLSLSCFEKSSFITVCDWLIISRFPNRILARFKVSYD